jgi:hypothetical protein
MSVDAQKPVEVSPRSVSRTRLLAAAAAVGLSAAIVVLYVFARPLLMRELGRIAGPSRTAAVVLGWAVWGVPIALALLSRMASRRATLPRPARIVLLGLAIVAWAPAIALLPGRGSVAQHEFTSLAIRQAPAVASSLEAGIGIGAVATLLCIPAIALSLTMRSHHPAGLAGLDRLMRPLMIVTITVLGLGVALAFGRAGPPGLPLQQLWPSGSSFTFNGQFVKPLAAERTRSCVNAVRPPRAETVIEDYGCGAVAHGLFTNRSGSALVSVTVIAMPTDGLSTSAASALQRINAVGVPLSSPPSAGFRPFDNSAAAVVQEGVGDELLVLQAARSDGKLTRTNSGPVLALGKAVANTIIYGLSGA